MWKVGLIQGMRKIYYYVCCLDNIECPSNIILIYHSKGWSNSCYGMSKVSVIAFTKILARNHPEMTINVRSPHGIETLICLVITY